jgi:hypothetical protein
LPRLGDEPHRLRRGALLLPARRSRQKFYRLGEIETDINPKRWLVCLSRQSESMQIPNNDVFVNARQLPTIVRKCYRTEESERKQKWAGLRLGLKD